MDPVQLFNVAAAVRDAVVDHYLSEGVDLPKRRLVTPGVPAWDCELLAVHAETVAAHGGDPVAALTPFLEGDPAYQLRAATIGVSIARCVPLTGDGSAPPVGDEQAVAIDVYQDMAMVWNAMVAAQAAGDLPCCGAIAFVSWQTLGPEGGFGGSLLRAVVSLE